MIKSHDLFAGGGSCLQFVKTPTPVECNKVRRNKMGGCLYLEIEGKQEQTSKVMERQNEQLRCWF